MDPRAQDGLGNAGLFSGKIPVRFKIRVISANFQIIVHMEIHAKDVVKEFFLSPNHLILFGAISVGHESGDALIVMPLTHDIANVGMMSPIHSFRDPQQGAHFLDDFLIFRRKKRKLPMFLPGRRFAVIPRNVGDDGFFARC